LFWNTGDEGYSVVERIVPYFVNERRLKYEYN